MVPCFSAANNRCVSPHARKGGFTFVSGSATEATRPGSSSALVNVRQPITHSSVIVR